MTKIGNCGDKVATKIMRALCYDRDADIFPNAKVHSKRDIGRKCTLSMCRFRFILGVPILRKNGEKPTQRREIRIIMGRRVARISKFIRGEGRQG